MDLPTLANSAQILTLVIDLLTLIFGSITLIQVIKIIRNTVNLRLTDILVGIAFLLSLFTAIYVSHAFPLKISDPQVPITVTATPSLQATAVPSSPQGIPQAICNDLLTKSYQVIYNQFTQHLQQIKPISEIEKLYKSCTPGLVQTSIDTTAYSTIRLVTLADRTYTIRLSFIWVSTNNWKIDEWNSVG